MAKLKDQNWVVDAQYRLAERKIFGCNEDDCLRNKTSNPARIAFTARAAAAELHDVLLVNNIVTQKVLVRAQGAYSVADECTQEEGGPRTGGDGTEQLHLAAERRQNGTGSPHIGERRRTCSK